MPEIFIFKFNDLSFSKGAKGEMEKHKIPRGRKKLPPMAHKRFNLAAVVVLGCIFTGK
jgi:hypothetical protein